MTPNLPNLPPVVALAIAGQPRNERGSHMLDRVRDWMTTSVITADPDMSVRSARELMWSNNIRHLPVLDGGQLVGVVSDRDLRGPDPLAATAVSQPSGSLLVTGSRSVRAVMMTAVQTVWPHDTIVYAASMMAQWKIGALLVQDGDRLVGIVTTTDCLRALVALHRTDSPRG